MLAAGARIFFELARWSNENFCWGNKTRHGLIWANSHSRSQDKCSFMPCQDQKCNINAFASVTDPPDASGICFLRGVYVFRLRHYWCHFSKQFLSAMRQRATSQSWHFQGVDWLTSLVCLQCTRPYEAILFISDWWEVGRGTCSLSFWQGGASRNAEVVYIQMIATAAVWWFYQGTLQANCDLQCSHHCCRPKQRVCGPTWSALIV